MRTRRREQVAPSAREREREREKSCCATRSTTCAERTLSQPARLAYREGRWLAKSVATRCLDSSRCFASSAIKHGDETELVLRSASDAWPHMTRTTQTS